MDCFPAVTVNQGALTRGITAKVRDTLPEPIGYEALESAHHTVRLGWKPEEHAQSSILTLVPVGYYDSPRNRTTRSIDTISIERAAVRLSRRGLPLIVEPSLDVQPQALIKLKVSHHGELHTALASEQYDDELFIRRDGVTVYAMGAICWVDESRLTEKVDYLIGLQDGGSFITHRILHKGQIQPYKVSNRNGVVTSVPVESSSGMLSGR